ncbi:MAG TPA: hypothetical protein VG406_28810 [Isosphaeraceae bacterium]|nr:hypothetical protein [Isosphaeraceae bacterium]
MSALIGRLERSGPLDGTFWDECDRVLGDSTEWLRDVIDDPEARRSLVEAIASKQESQAAERDRLEVEDEAPARQHARILALIDPSDEALRLAKYEATHESTLHRSLKALDRRPRTGRLSEPHFEPEIVPVPVEYEPNSAPVTAQYEPNSTQRSDLRIVTMPVPRISRKQPRLDRWKFPAMVIVCLLTGLLVGSLRSGGNRRNSLVGQFLERIPGASDAAVDAHRVPDPTVDPAPGEVGSSAPVTGSRTRDVGPARPARGGSGTAR